MIVLEVGGEEGFKRSLGILRNAVQDMDAILGKTVEPFLLDHMDKQFKTSGQHGGKPWALYASEPRYEAWKEKVAGHKRPLEMREGFMRLKPSLTNKTHPEYIFQVTSSGTTFGTKVPYAVSLDKGGVGPFGERFPPRKIFAYTPDQINSLVRDIQRLVMRSLKAGQRTGVRSHL